MFLPALSLALIVHQLQVLCKYQSHKCQSNAWETHKAQCNQMVGRGIAPNIQSALSDFVNTHGSVVRTRNSFTGPCHK